MQPGGPARPQIIALVPCAGVGARAGPGVPKQYRLIADQPLIGHTLAALQNVGRIHHVLVVVAPGDTRLAGQQKGWELADCGGATRAATVVAGLAHLRASGAAAHDWVLVHDAARCLIRPADVHRLINACLPDRVGGLLALPLADTLKQSANGRAMTTLERGDKWLAQTPQMFRLGMLQAALAAHAASDYVGITDEASAMEAAGHQPLLVRGSWQNIKLTWPEDFEFAAQVLQARISATKTERSAATPTHAKPSPARPRG